MTYKERFSSAKELLASAELLPPVQNGLMTIEQLAYDLSWHEKFGDQEKVVDNAIGPAIGHILYLTNSSDIVGIDTTGFWNRYTAEYITRYWHLVDSKPVHLAGTINCRPENSQPDQVEEELFKAHQEDRKTRGYWDQGALHKWGIDRLLMIEFKKIGVDPGTIRLFPYEHPEMASTSSYEIIEGWSGLTEIHFDWAYPEEAPKPRKLLYLTATLDRIPDWLIAKEISKVNFFHQKSLINHSLTTKYLRLILPQLSPKAVVAIGHLFKGEGNWQYRKEIEETLGLGFQIQSADPQLEAAIDQISPADEIDEIIGSKDYGMKLHVFSRGYQKKSL